MDPVCWRGGGSGCGGGGGHGSRIAAVVWAVGQ